MLAAGRGRVWGGGGGQGGLAVALTQWHQQEPQVVEPVGGLAGQLLHEEAEDHAQVALVPCHNHLHRGRHVGVAVTAAGGTERPPWTLGGSAGGPARPAKPSIRALLLPRRPGEPRGGTSALASSGRTAPELHSLSLDAGDGGVEGRLDVRHRAGGHDQLLVRQELLAHVLPR